MTVVHTGRFISEAGYEMWATAKETYQAHRQRAMDEAIIREALERWAKPPKIFMVTKAVTTELITNVSSAFTRHWTDWKAQRDDEMNMSRALEKWARKPSRKKSSRATIAIKCLMLLLPFLLMESMTTCSALELAPEIVACQHVMVSLRANATTNRHVEDHHYDTDSHLVAIDNCSSRCVTNNERDYIDKPRGVSVAIDGLGGKSVARLVGTVELAIEDDDGRVVKWRIPNTYCFKDAPYRLLSPQHWAQVTEERVDDCWCKTNSREVTLTSHRNKFTRTIRLDSASTQLC